jgi:hypothetical protein
MEEARFQLSVEELAFVLGILGGADVARGFLLSILGERPRQDLEQRLLTASHSLMARGYLELEGETKCLDQRLSDTVGPLLRNEFSLRCSRSAAGAEQILNYYVQGSALLEQETIKAVLFRLQIISGLPAALERSAEFFDLPRKGAAKGPDEAMGTIAVSLMEKARESVPSSSKQQVAALFVSARLSPDVAADLAEDLFELEYRGSVIRIEREDERMVSNTGFLLLKGARRFWILDIVPRDPPLLNVFRGTSQRYRAFFDKLWGQG